MAPSCFVSVVQADWRAMVRRKHHSLHELLVTIPLWTPVHPSSDSCVQQNSVSQNSDPFKLGFWTWQRGPSNKALLWWDSHHGCAADTSAPTVWCCHDSLDQNLWGIFPIKSELRETGGWSQYTQNKNKNKKDWKTIPYQHFKGLNVHYWAGLSVLCFFSVSAINLYKRKMAILETAYV